MKTKILSLLVLLSIGCQPPKDNKEESFVVPGLSESVEVYRDSYGINHIYANNQSDLFFTQGYLAAKDRLFQFEVWRRQATGTVAELLGERELQRDIGTRLFKFRGDMNEEMSYYHEDGVEIISSYVDGVNAYIDEVLQKPEDLPVTFKALDMLPEKWTPEVVISRHQGLLGNIETELAVGRAVAGMGSEKTQKYFWFHPKKPNLDLDPTITSELLEQDVLGLYNAYRKPVGFQPEDIVPEFRSTTAFDIEEETDYNLDLEKLWFGSNNWVTDPTMSENGHSYMANDPHRTLAVPSLRYWAHLVAPGWNVIGGGEPEIPGISIGHNEYGAWGLTVFRTDGEDLMVYDLNPENLLQYKYQGEWESMEVITESIPVKGKEPVSVDLRYTRHGPVTFIDSTRLKAFAVRCAWMEPGGSPYLASLRMDQAKTWEEFREACNYSHIPGENMIWADQKGNIGWQAVGIAPLRRNFSGMIPVPGDGRFEWDGYLPIKEKPSILNPKEGFLATANENVTPPDYGQWDAIGFSWSDPFRGDRIRELLSGEEKLSLNDMKSLQTDYTSLPARILVPQLNQRFGDEIVQQSLEVLGNWNYQLSPDSYAAAIYVSWENRLVKDFLHYFPDPEAEPFVSRIQLSKILMWLQADEDVIPANKKEEYLKGTFIDAINDLQDRYGTSSVESWVYGSEQFKHVQIIHPLGRVVKREIANQLNTPLLPRGGNQFTPGSTGRNENQSSGATFRLIVDVNDWDASVGANSPGQSGDPDSKYYMNLFAMWANDDYFPVYYSKALVKNNSTKTTLNP